MRTSIKEDLLHYLWKLKRFDFEDLRTTDGEPLSILHFGQHNDNAGPDFLGGMVKINDTTWSGNIEFHIHASDWYKHQHDIDNQYNNVILHVVWLEDKPVLNSAGIKIPCLELHNRIDPDLLQRVDVLFNNQNWIPCQSQLSEIQKPKFKSYLNFLTEERLATKMEELQGQLSSLNYHWEQLLFERMATAFGLKVNSQAFLCLSQSLTIERLQKHRGQLFSLEALLFGQAGFLSKRFRDPYPNLLLKEYLFLKHKYGIGPIPLNFWKFSRLRPSNFPTVRIAQLAAFLDQSGPLFSFILENDVVYILRLFRQLKASSYWDTHYLFDKPSEFKIKKLGRSRIFLILINSIVPLLYLYGLEKKNTAFQNKALDLLEALPSEDNQVLRKWKTLGFIPDNSFESQGLIHLKNYYCDHKRCLSCSIGQTLLR